MGFLDRLAADLIGDATGLPVRRLVRRVGVKNLVLLGGAVAAGGLAAQKVAESRGQGSQGTGAGDSVPPPPPPAPAPVDLPPLPQVDPPVPPLPGADPVGGSEPDDLTPDEKFAVVRTMVSAALSDGRLAPQEREAIHHHLVDSGLEEPQIAQIHQDLVISASPEELGAMAATTVAREALLRAALLVLRADREVSVAERAWLSRLATALAVDEGRALQIERDLEDLAAQM